MASKKVVAAALFALTAGLTTGVAAPPANGWSETLLYTCSGPGFGSEPTYTFAAVYETDVPATLPYGSERATAWEAHLLAPESFRAWAVSQGYTTLHAGVRLMTAINGASQLPEMYQATPAMTVPTSPQTWTWDTRPTTSQVTASSLGRHVLSVGSLGVTVAFLDAGGPRLATSATCILDTSTPDALVDSFDVVAATSTTKLAVTGDVATATVTTNGTAPVGVVTFSVAGRSVAMDVAGGKATAKLPTVPPGSHPVSATFVPSQPSQLSSSVGTASYTVPPFATTTEVSAAYKPDRDLMKARARVKAADRSTVVGRVTFVLMRSGRTLARATVGLSDAGATAKKFRGITKRGRYVVSARYLGSTTYAQSKDRLRLTLP